MTYTVQQISLAPIAGVHEGTGTHQSTTWVVEPATVPGSGRMDFTGYSGEVTTMLFAIADQVVPNWFGVAVPHGISDFTRAHIFFHPTPGQAGYVEGDYAKKLGKWPQLFYYMERLGYQLDSAHRNQVLIMPFMTESAKNGGILPAAWQDIVQQILTHVRADIDPADTSPLAIRQLVVSSFSAGIIYSDSFRRTGAGVSSLLAEVWDFDGRASSFRSLSEGLHSTTTVAAIKYDQIALSDTSAYHVPAPRWTQLPNPPSSFDDVHASIRDFMFLDAASVSQVGSVIDVGAALTTGTHTATHAVSATHTGTLSGSLGTAIGTTTAGDTGTHTASTMTGDTAGHTGSTAGGGTGTPAGGRADTGTSTTVGPSPAVEPAPPISASPIPASPIRVSPIQALPVISVAPAMTVPAPGETATLPAAVSPGGFCAPIGPLIVAVCAVNAQTALAAITGIIRKRHKKF